MNNGHHPKNRGELLAATENKVGQLVYVGDCGSDLTLIGGADRIAEVPHIIFDMNTHFGIGLSMAGLVATGGARLAPIGKCMLISGSGDDNFQVLRQHRWPGRAFLDLALSEAPSNLTAEIATFPGRSTTVKIREYVPNPNEAGKMMWYYHRTDCETVTPCDWSSQQVSTEAKNAYSEAQIVGWSDYGKGVVTPTLMSQLTPNQEAIVFFDPKPRKGRDLAYYHQICQQGKVNVIKPNRDELALLLGEESKDEDNLHVLKRRADELRGALQVDCVMATLGVDGVIVSDKNGTFHIRTPKVSTEGFTGAGCAFLAGAMFGCAITGGNLRAAAFYGAVSGTSVVYTSEVVPASIERLRGKLTAWRNTIPFCEL